jgi:hypothetical protein
MNGRTAPPPGTRPVMLVRRRHAGAQLEEVSEQPLPLAGPPSFALQARPEDDGAMWPALAGRCRRALPASLQWAARFSTYAAHCRCCAPKRRCASCSDGWADCRTPNGCRSAASGEQPRDETGPRAPA